MIVGTAARMRCGGWIRESAGVRLGTDGRVGDDTASVAILHGDIEVDADEDAFSLDVTGKVVVVDEELVGERHGGRGEEMRIED